MRKILYLLSVLLLAGCTVKSQPSSSWKTTEEEPETIEHVLIVDYQDDGGANIPTACVIFQTILSKSTNHYIEKLRNTAYCKKVICMLSL